MKTLFQIIMINVVIFLIVHFAHFRFFQPKIVFMAGLIDTMIAVTTTSILASLIFKDATLVVASGMLCASASMLYVTLIPTMVDRSITVYTLLSLHDAGPDGLSEKSISEQLRGNRIIEKRFEDLEKTGAINNNNGQLTLTQRGYVSAMVFALNMKILSLDREYKIFRTETHHSAENQE